MEGFKRMLESTDIEVLREYFYEAVGHYPNGLDKNQIIQVLLLEKNQIIQVLLIEEIRK